MRVTTAYFANDSTQAAAYPHLWQWDYGQKLVIKGIELPEQYSAHIYNDGGTSADVVNGDADGVLIPDVYLETGRNIIVCIYLHSSADDGETLYKIKIPVSRREYLSERTHTPNKRSEQETVFDYVKILEDKYLMWDAHAYRPFDHARSPRSEQEMVFDLGALLNVMSWNNTAKKKN